MSLINIAHLTFAYEGSYDNIFEDVSFQIDTDWKLGFTGRNGRGKTTFLNLLMEKYPYEGTISSTVEFEYFPYPVPDTSKDTLSVLEEILPDFAYWMLVRELTILEVDEGVLYRPFSTLSNGEQTKVLLAVMFLKENCFLLIDEPTNHLDVRGRELVSRYLSTKKGFILISHDRAFLDGCIDHILSINKTNIEVQKGNFSSWYENKERQDHFEMEQNERLRKDIRRLEAAARQSREWADKVERTKIGYKPHADKLDSFGGRAYLGEQSRRMQQRRKNLENRQQKEISEKQKLLKNIENADDLKIFQADYHTDRFLQLKDVAISYGTEKPVCSGVSFTLNKGDRIALCGKNGCGKSSILKLICGLPIPCTGTLEIGSGLKISYVPQDTSHLSGSLTDYAKEQGIDESIFKAILRKLDFSRIQFEKNMEDYSGGQKKKVLLAASLCNPAHLHVWDEPMNFVDVISRIQMEELILQYCPTLLFVDHDRVFTEKIATKIINL